MDGIHILDGPTGTELIARGFQAHPVLWSARAALDAPKLLYEVHAAYLAAGANIITANTFRTSGHSVVKAGYSVEEARRLTHTSVAIATDAVEAAEGDRQRLIAGSLAPLEDCYIPRLTPSLEVLEREHLQTAGWLVESGCQLVLAETMPTAREATVAVRAARKAGAPLVAVSFITEPSGARLLGGDPLRETALECLKSGADIVMVNCVNLDVVEQALPFLRDAMNSGATLGFYANAAKMLLDPLGNVTWEEDTRSEAVRVEEYGRRASEWKSRFGVRIFGSCCGTSPAYTRVLSKKLL